MKSNIVTDANGNETHFEYDAANRLTRKTYSDGTFHTYAYDPSGNLTNWLDARGASHEYIYDALSRIIRVNPRSSAATSTVTYSYDIYGRLTNWADGTFTESIFFDDANATVTRILDYGPFSKTNITVRDAYGRLESFTGPDGTTTSYRYDGRGLVGSVEIPGEGAISLSRDSHGRISRIAQPGVNHVAQDYGAFLMRTNQALNAAGNPIYWAAYVADRENRIVERKTSEGDFAYTYDQFGYLASMQASAQADESFTFDAADNRVASSYGATNTTYVVNSLNQYISATSALFAVNYSHDPNGT